MKRPRGNRFRGISVVGAFVPEMGKVERYLCSPTTHSVVKQPLDTHPLSHGAMHLSLSTNFVPPNRGRRESRVSDAPAAARVVVVARALVTTSSPETSGFPRAMGLTAYFVLSPVTGLFCHRRLADTSARLDTSVGVSGPHDFAVRFSTVRQRRIHVHRIPHSTSVTTAKRPSYERGMA